MPPDQRPPLVMAFLGHKKPHNTFLYVQLDEKLFRYHDDINTATTVDEACALVKAGFEYVTDVDGVKLFRKRK